MSTKDVYATMAPATFTRTLGGGRAGTSPAPRIYGRSHRDALRDVARKLRKRRRHTPGSKALADAHARLETKLDPDLLEIYRTASGLDTKDRRPSHGTERCAECHGPIGDYYDVKPYGKTAELVVCLDCATPETKVRHVRTPAGARKYGEPIGAPIVRDPDTPGKGSKKRSARQGSKPISNEVSKNPPTSRGPSGGGNQQARTGTGGPSRSRSTSGGRRGGGGGGFNGPDGGGGLEGGGLGGIAGGFAGLFGALLGSGGSSGTTPKPKKPKKPKKPPKPKKGPAPKKPKAGSGGKGSGADKDKDTDKKPEDENTIDDTGQDDFNNGAIQHALDLLLRLPVPTQEAVLRALPWEAQDRLLEYTGGRTPGQKALTDAVGWLETKGAPSRMPHQLINWWAGPGKGRWATSPHPYTSLYRQLREHGVPKHMVGGAAANVFKRVFGIYPAQRPRALGGSTHGYGKGAQALLEAKSRLAVGPHH